MDIETAGLKPSPIKGIICNHLCRQVELRNLTYAYILVGELSGWTEAQPYIR